MLGREKPFEILSDKEKEAYQLAKDIVLWTRDEFVAQWPGALEILDRANKLYNLVNGMDAEHDDQYYKVHEMVGQLRREYESMRDFLERVNDGKDGPNESVVSWDFNVDEGSIDVLIDDIRRVSFSDIKELKVVLSAKKTNMFAKFYFFKTAESDNISREKFTQRFSISETIGGTEKSTVSIILDILLNHYQATIEQIGGEYYHYRHQDDLEINNISFDFNEATWDGIEEKLRLIINRMRESTVSSG